MYEEMMALLIIACIIVWTAVLIKYLHENKKYNFFKKSCRLFTDHFFQNQRFPQSAGAGFCRRGNHHPAGVLRRRNRSYYRPYRKRIRNFRFALHGYSTSPQSCGNSGTDTHLEIKILSREENMEAAPRQSHCPQKQCP